MGELDERYEPDQSRLRLRTRQMPVYGGLA